MADSAHAGAPDVLFLFRRPYRTGHYSLESLFGEVLRRLQGTIQAQRLVARFHSRGVLRRLAICVEAFLRRRTVNFITGDIVYLAGVLPRGSTIVVIPDCGLLYATRGLRRWLQELLWYRIPCRRAARVVAISEATRRDLRTILRDDSVPIDVIPCFISERFRRVDRPFRAERPVLLHVGQSANKNLERIIEALRGLPVHLTIIGSLSPANQARLRAAEISHDQFVNLTQEEVVRCYEDCDMLLFPSTYEGFGLPIIEAQVVGRPVLTSSTTSMPWVAGDAACFVDPYSVASIREGVVRLITDAPYREDLVQKGFANASRFDADRIVEAYLEVIRSVAAHRAPGDSRRT